MQQLLRRFEIARITSLFISESGVAGWLEQGLESYDTAIMCVLQHFSLRLFSVSTRSYLLFGKCLKIALATDSNTIFFSQIF